MRKLLLVMTAALAVTACGDDGDETSCPDVRPLGVDRTCNEGMTFAPGQPLTIRVEPGDYEECADLDCKVEHEGGDIFFTLTQELCSAREEQRDGPVRCAVGLLACEIPALDEGQYTLRVNGAPFGFVTVEAGANDTQCF